MLKYDTAPELTSDYIDSVWQTLPQFLRPTLLLSSPKLSELLGCHLTIACETFQYTGSFKFRAAYNLLSGLSQLHIVAASSGNFGQGIAYASQLLGKQSTIVMPETSARVKVAAIESYGATVDLIDVKQISRVARVQQLLAEQSDAFWAHAYDDYRVVVGNSTLGQEILTHGEFDSIIAPMGGGGLCSGMVIARDHLNSSTAIIGAEPLAANDAARSFQAGRLLKNEQEPATIADGARTVSLGELNWEILRSGLTDIIEVPDSLTIQALRHYFLDVNLKVEPTGALALGALLAQPQRFAGQRVCCIVSGGNVDPDLYAQLLTQS